MGLAGGGRQLDRWRAEDEEMLAALEGLSLSLTAAESEAAEGEQPELILALLLEELLCDLALEVRE